VGTYERGFPRGGGGGPDFFNLKINFKGGGGGGGQKAPNSGQKKNFLRDPKTLGENRTGTRGGYRPGAGSPPEKSSAPGPPTGFEFRPTRPDFSHFFSRGGANPQKRFSHRAPHRGKNGRSHFLFTGGGPPGASFFFSRPLFGQPHPTPPKRAATPKEPFLIGLVCGKFFRSHVKTQGGEKFPRQAPTFRPTCYPFFIKGGPKFL